MKHGMKHGMKQYVGTTLLVLCLLGATQVRAAVPLYGMFETSVTNTTPYANKFRDVDLHVTYTAPSGREVEFFGFFDGDGTGGPDHLDVRNFPADSGGELSGTVWKLRFMPDEVGTWTYAWSFSDNSISGSGSFSCTASGARPGVLNPLPTNPRWLQSANGAPFFPKTMYCLPGDQIPYDISVYAPNVYDKYIARGANLIVFNWLPIWTWNTHQTNPANGEGDINVLLWYQTGNWTGPDSQEDPDVSIYDTDRMNLFTWKRLEQHIGYLADQGVYTWGFQGFNIKRTFDIMPHLFPADKYAWYIRYCMARLAPYYNVVWNNTWESDNGADALKNLLQNEGYDPWRRILFRVDSDHSRYDLFARDRHVDFPKPDGFEERSLWSTESNGLWHLNKNDWDLVWRFILDGATPYGTENGYDAWDAFNGVHVERVFHAFTFIGDETDFATLTPHRELAAGGDTYCLAEPGRQYVCYDRDGSSMTINLQAGSYHVTWLDPLTDARDTGADIAVAAGNHTFTPPSSAYKVVYIHGDGVVDATPPSTVENLSATTVNDQLVELSWDSASDAESDISGYRVYRGGSLLSTTTATSYADTTTAPSTAYSYTVAAVNGANLEGEQSEASELTTPPFNNPPTVSLVTPVDERAHVAVTPLLITAVAGDSDGSVASVEFLVITQSGGQDEILRHTDSNGSDGWSTLWPAPAPGTYDLTATATDDKQKTTQSSTHVLHVNTVTAGDVDHNGAVELADAVLLLQVSSGHVPEGSLYLDADMSGNGKLDLAEVIAILRLEAGL